MKNLKVPFHANGDLISYPYPWADTVQWKDNFQFEDTIRFVGIERGRSAAHFIVESSTTGRRYPMFMVEVMSIFKNTDVFHGQVTGMFTFVKRGTNYALGFVK